MPRPADSPEWPQRPSSVPAPLCRGSAAHTRPGRRFVSETLWASRPLPSLERPDRAVWRGAPATLAELRVLRMQLRAALSEDGRPPRATDDDVERLLLAVEELVSNGLRHGRGPVEAAVTTAEERLAARGE